MEISIDDQPGEKLFAAELEDWGPNPEQRYSQAELHDILETTIAQLPTGYRVVFQLRDVEGFSTQETAQALSLSTVAVKSRLRRARFQLRALLSTYFKRRTPATVARTCAVSSGKVFERLPSGAGIAWSAPGANIGFYKLAMSPRS